MKSIYLTNVKLKPILEKLEEGQIKLNEGQQLLNTLNKEKEEFEEKADRLKSAAEECMHRKEEIQSSLEHNILKLNRANALLRELNEEETRWAKEIAHYNNLEK